MKVPCWRAMEGEWLEGLRVSQTFVRAVEEVYERAVEQEILSPPPLDTTEINLNRFSLPLAQVAMVAHLKRLAEAARQAVPAPALAAAVGSVAKEDRVVGGGDVVDGPYRKAAPACSVCVHEWRHAAPSSWCWGATTSPAPGARIDALVTARQRQPQPAMAEFLRTSSRPDPRRMRIKKRRRMLV